MAMLRDILKDSPTLFQEGIDAAQEGGWNYKLPGRENLTKAEWFDCLITLSLGTLLIIHVWWWMLNPTHCVGGSIVISLNFLFGAPRRTNPNSEQPHPGDADFLRRGSEFFSFWVPLFLTPPATILVAIFFPIINDCLIIQLAQSLIAVACAWPPSSAKSRWLSICGYHLVFMGCFGVRLALLKKVLTKRWGSFLIVSFGFFLSLPLSVVHGSFLLAMFSVGSLRCMLVYSFVPASICGALGLDSFTCGAESSFAIVLIVSFLISILFLLFWALGAFKSRKASPVFTAMLMLGPVCTGALWLLVLSGHFSIMQHVS